MRRCEDKRPHGDFHENTATNFSNGAVARVGVLRMYRHGVRNSFRVHSWLREGIKDTYAFSVKMRITS